LLPLLSTKYRPKFEDAAIEAATALRAVLLPGTLYAGFQLAWSFSTALHDDMDRRLSAYQEIIGMQTSFMA
jgi:hypothetical protein